MIQNTAIVLDNHVMLWYNIKAVCQGLAEELNIRGVTQFGRVLGLGPRCRRFESCRLDHISFKNLSKNFEKNFKKGLTNEKRCGIINKSVKETLV